MKVVTIVGARPQFIKAAAISRVLRADHTEVMVHTGQHYDQNMSQVFFDELGIPAPDYNLEIGSGSHGSQTGAMLAAIEEVLKIEKPGWVLVYGDTNSTLAGALAAAKLHIKVAHVEAGLRSYNRRMPEEINRVLTDHISSLLFCPSQNAVLNLAKEGITEGAHLIGDVMYDALEYARSRLREIPNILTKLGLKEKGYLLATVHRAENTDDPVRLDSILQAINRTQEDVVSPVHPRTRKAIENLDIGFPSTVMLIDPVGYLDMVRLEEAARMILTDSGGIQKEAYWLEVPCITLREETEWVETVEEGWNVLVGANQKAILDSITSFRLPKAHPQLYGDSNAGQRSVAVFTAQMIKDLGKIYGY
jgi:UDP-GlcNAc3NAcA epimerase